jgi:ABC-2 type transport system ATP-binding protein
VRRKIGYIGQGTGAGHYHDGRDELVLQGRAYGMGWRAARQRADELLAALQLETLAKRTAGTLSGGQRRRLDIAMGQVHAPPLLFLDEPSTGLDPQNRANLWDHVLGVRERFGTTLFLTTHYLDEADTMAERVMIIDQGRVIADDTPANLKSHLAGDRVTLTLADPADAGPTREAAEALAPLRAFELEIGRPLGPGAPVEGGAPRGGRSAEAGAGAGVGPGADGGVGATARLRVPGGAKVLPPLLRELDRRGVTIGSAEVARPTLDDVFLSLTGRSLREEGAVADPGADETDQADEASDREEAA